MMSQSRRRSTLCRVILGFVSRTAGLPVTGDDAGAHHAPQGHHSPATNPQYIFVNKSPTVGSAPISWHQSHPESFTPKSCEQIITVIGSRGTPRLRSGVSFMFSILDGKPEILVKSVRSLLMPADKADAPVLIGLDGQKWCGGRPDLWNWWELEKVGFGPANRMNVEWTGWGPAHARQDLSRRRAWNDVCVTSGTLCVAFPPHRWNEGVGVNRVHPGSLRAFRGI